MARGDKGTYNQQQQQSYNQASNLEKTAQANSGAAYNAASQGYESELANPGYTPAEKQAMTQAVAGSLAGAFGSARGQLMDQTARTGNAAGYGAAEEELAREQARENSQAMGGLQQAFGQAEIQGRQNALAGMDQLYGQTNPQIATGLGAQSSLVGTQARVATTPSFLQRLGGAFLGGLNLGGGGTK